ncbi:hypothetical protein ATE84_1401 [Aquimarina sp. MAR_2010_214]|nr:hypothetical protein ATE84_1401 [Aquimarina sp. MAR_2010_214]
MTYFVAAKMFQTIDNKCFLGCFKCFGVYVDFEKRGVLPLSKKGIRLFCSVKNTSYEYYIESVFFVRNKHEFYKKSVKEFF